MTNPYPWRRRNFFIKKEFQGKFILSYAITLIGLAALVTWILSIKMRQALEVHLYSSHLNIERTGDFMFDLLVRTNMYAIVGILALVLLVSSIIVNRLNRHFSRMCATLNAMARGRFDTPPIPESHFHEITNLIRLVEELKLHYRERFVAIHEALQTVEAGCNQLPDRTRLQEGRDRLQRLLDQVYLPE
ncbi:hypothetical protein EDC39_105175 [Geothermobacter ehrlichii]|uniref:HAMP domain-containing protein n=1 Tax=Geothermobacter ehrlichii TaxID=213224 RepID=A0A5D3WMN2_9BACT|nr:hypothetical protein [Geothermobacter ehrlichii]TYO98806.1 hypothetical protein EDC39_105175 [Geothermobacter ehrlichii]